MKYLVCIIFFVLTSTNVLFSQVSFEAKVSKKNLGLNERLRVDFVMNQDGDNFSPPAFENFTVVGGPNQSVSNSWINGVRSYSKTYSYYLMPKRKGTFAVGQASIQIEGATYKSSPVNIQVSEAVEKPKDPNDPNYVASQNIDLVAEVSNSSPYLNEAVSIIYKLYWSPSVDIKTPREIDAPRYNDFWSQNIKIKEYDIKTANFKGEERYYVVYKKVVLYPQKTGKLTIEPLTLDVPVVVPTSRRDFFGNRMRTQVSKTITAGSRTLKVKPLPEVNRPANFTGAVGDFTLDVSLNKTTLDALESLVAKVEVSGKGNLKLFDLPQLTVPSALEVYEPEHKEQVTTYLSGMKGKISDSYTIIPQFQGKYPLPKVSFSFFDPVSESYKTLSSDDLLITVLKEPINGDSEPKNSKQQVNKILKETSSFKYIKLETQLSEIESKDWFNSLRFWLLFLLPILLLPIVLYFKKFLDARNADVLGSKARGANRLAKKYLSEAKKQININNEFYIALEKALHNFIKSKLHIENQELNKDRIQELLINGSVDLSDINDFLALLAQCEMARYAPSSTSSSKTNYSKAIEIISKIDKQLR